MFATLPYKEPCDDVIIVLQDFLTDRTTTPGVGVWAVAVRAAVHVSDGVLDLAGPARTLPRAQLLLTFRSPVTGEHHGPDSLAAMEHGVAERARFQHLESLSTLFCHAV